MGRLITSWKECGYSKPYLLDSHKRICSYPCGSPWCKIHPHDLVDGFPFDCKLKEVKDD